MRRLLGEPTSATINRLNETMIHVYEAFLSGANEAVVSRLVPEAAEIKYMVAKNDPSAAAVWTVETALPGSYLFAIKHLECFNEGVRAEVHGVTVLDEALDAVSATNVPLTGTIPLTIAGVTITNGMRVKLTNQSTPAQNGVYTVGIVSSNYTLTAAPDEIALPTKEVVVRLVDLNGTELYRFEGSLDPLAKDEFNNSRYLPNVCSAITDAVEITVAASAEVATTSAFYGDDGNGAAKYTGANLVYFTEGGTTYASGDVDDAIARLKYSEFPFGYLIGGGSRNVSILSKLIALGVDINKQVLWDIPGDLAPAAAIAFYKQLSIDTHYSQAYYAPLLSDDPLNGGKDFIGTSGANVGMRCARNARMDANGIAPKNYPVAGKNWPLSRTGIVQKTTPTEQELDDLARSRINPVLFERYNSGSGYVFTDSLTGAVTEGDRKLIAVADMASQVDDWVAAYAKEVLHLPMQDAIRRMTDFLQQLFEALEAARWIKPTTELDSRSFVATVQANALRPADRMDVNYWLKYDGTTRAIFAQQTLSK
jgi:hypothetical protein